MQLQVETQIYKKDAIGNDVTEAGTKATNYIVDLNNGISVHPAGNVVDRVEITSNGTEIYQNGNSVAEYGATARIGKEDSSRFIMGANILQAYDDHNNKYFEVSANGLTYGTNITVASEGYVTNSINTSEDNLKDYVDDAIVNAVGEGTTGLKQYVDNHLEELQKQVDGAIDTWYYAVDPTLINEPTSNWDTDEDKTNHLRDLYFNTTTGHTFRWAVFQTLDTEVVLSKTYYTYNSTTNKYISVLEPTLNNLSQYYEFGWIKIEDTDAIKALADAAAAQDTADGKRRVFVDNPVPPYDIGDLWVGGEEGDIKRCAYKRVEDETYNLSTDWVLASKYTGDESLNNYKNEVRTTYATNQSVDNRIGQITQSVNKLTVKTKGMYAVSSSLANEINKTATITPALSNDETWELFKGTSITVKFTNANSVAVPTLNINNTGAKEIRNYNGVLLDENEYKWIAGRTFTFVCDSTYKETEDETVQSGKTYYQLNNGEYQYVELDDNEINPSNLGLYELEFIWLMQDSTVAVQINEAKTSISHTATSIESLASNQTEYIKPDGTTGTNLIASAISQNAEDISLKVSQNDVINQINVSTEGVKIDASKIKISGTTTFVSGSTNTTLADVYAQKSDAIAEEQLIYIQAVSGTNSVPAYPSSATTTSSYWVTETGESIPIGTPPSSEAGQTPVWTIKRPSYQSNYPVIFIAKQRKTLTGTITCSTPLKDDSLTIIDGGHITTGTIDASRVNVTNINADNILTGTIGIGRLDNNLQNEISDAKNTADYFINADSNGILVHPRSDTNNGVHITDSNIEILKDGKTIAKYGQTVSVGNENGLHIKLDGEELGFYVNDTDRVAYIRNDRLFIEQSVVVKQMDVGLKINSAEGEPQGSGQWSWKVHENSETPKRNNLYLKWIG